MKPILRFLGLGTLVLATSLQVTSCSSGASEEETVAGNGVTASEFASGAGTFYIYGASAFSVRPTGGAGKVDPAATSVKDVEGFIDVGSEAIPVYFTYKTLGDIETTGVVTATIEVSLKGTENLKNANFLIAIGSPKDGTFKSATIEMNYLANTATVVSVVTQPVTVDPDEIGVGDLITGGTIPQTSSLDGLKFYMQPL